MVDSKGEEGRPDSLGQRVPNERDRPAGSTRETIRPSVPTSLAGPWALVVRLSVGWMAFWAVYACLAVGAGVGILFMEATPGGTAVEIVPILLLLLCAIGFVTLCAVTYLRVIVWLRNFGEWVWNRFTAPYEDTPYYDDPAGPEEALSTVKKTVVRQLSWATAGAIGMVYVAFLYETESTILTSAVADLVPVTAVFDVLPLLFPPLAFTAAAVQQFLPESSNAIVLLTLLVGIPVIPFAFPIRNALYWAEHAIMARIEAFRPLLPVSRGDAAAVAGCALVSVGGPASLYYVVAALDL